MMTRKESTEYRALRDRFDGPRGDGMPAADVARFLELDRRASDELDAMLAVHPLIDHSHCITEGGGAWSCSCGAGETAPWSAMGSHRHLQAVRAERLAC